MKNSTIKKTKKTRSWLWQLYFLLTLIFVLSTSAYFFFEKASINIYYQILLAFDIHFLIPYCLNVLSILLNLTSLLPFYLFVICNNYLSKTFCQYLFIARLIFDILGRSYELNIIKSLQYQGKLSFWAAIFILVTFSLPSYIANYLYAFKRKD